jgi:hypothetical protein
VEKSLEQLKLAETQLADILDWEAKELEVATQNAKLIDAALKKANPHESTKSSSTTAGTSSGSPHPLFGGIVIPQAQQVALEDLASSIQSSQADIDLALLVQSGKGLVVPFMPPRSVEYELAMVDNLCWNLPNINLLAPISTHMWRIWATLSMDEIECLKSNVIHNTGILKDTHHIPSSFSLALFDHKKCASTELKIHTK